ncbi:class I SAM-dependent RNA methyltransferase [Polymorphum gilvum]|uniref:tRNA (Uracil-5-)-methyltransferase superfamily n=1 Tax=Polymorphum gilvum (strain LMG 25793 / CGMCC 1.9160 / SL003B-26A1) TaxID=991905 RepID=F2IYB5_POLGS|nr:class I SAM-dependent RNA methyltransferase [Polymorphum gilvum]ADZ71727.1 tRNA (Uracil-5-)-methyltransferase superfamily [Polymorphum gilvum SL003B-26A1]
MTDATLELTITGLGHRGDGLADGPDGPLFVAGALPGERVRARVAGQRATMVDLLQPSPERITPVCRHVERCGGCNVQHLAPDPYLAWKRDLVIEALADRGIAAEVGATVAARPATRRRAALTAVRAGHKILLGYHEKASHRLVDVTECPVLVPAITAALPGLKTLAAALMPRRGEVRIAVLASEAGLDVAVGNAAPGTEKKLVALTALAADLDLARLSVDGETIVERRAPVLTMGRASVVPPPGAFTQATAEAETALAGLVAQALGPAKRAADLFAGIGTFTLRMAETASVHAVEAEAAALAALDRAIRVPRGLKQVTLERRDLFRRPLMAAELAPFDAVVFDPPRAGAQAQAEQLAQSRVARIAAVSCNPATLARDLRILIDGGYRLLSVTPVDQFLFSTHVEAVAALER